MMIEPLQPRLLCASNPGLSGTMLRPSYRVAATATVVSSDAFQIKLTVNGSGASQAVRDAFATAAARWMQVITGKQASLSIAATISDIDGEGNVLGQAGPTILSRSTGLPTEGVMQFDTADVANLISNGSFNGVVLHEMGHVLGIGSLWEDKGLVSGTSDPRYVGRSAIAAYRQIGGTEQTIPLEDTGGTGTRGSHWRESVFKSELMTGFLGTSEDLVTNPLSRMTAASLSDLGYKGVNLSSADDYKVPGSTEPVEPVPTVGSIFGRVFKDTNSNGRFDKFESGFEGRMIYIDANTNGRYDSGERMTSSDAAGAYTFDQLGAGSYTVAQILPSEMRQTLPAAVGVFDAPGLTITLATGQDATGVNLGSRPFGGGVTGVVFVDKNKNKKQDKTESRLPGVWVFMDTNRNGRLDDAEWAALTDSTGRYLLVGVPAGTYRFAVRLTNGRTQTFASQATATITVGGLATGPTFGVTTPTVSGRSSVSKASSVSLDRWTGITKSLFSTSPVA